MPRPYSIEQFGAGRKVYRGGSTSPHSGGGLDPIGYKERDARTRMRRNSLLRRMKAANTQNYMNENWLGGQNGIRP
jgi:hypothetical protein